MAIEDVTQRVYADIYSAGSGYQVIYRSMDILFSMEILDDA